MLRNLLRKALGLGPMPKYKQVRNLGDYADKKIPWWCMDPKHQPYFNEHAYDAHMLDVHKVDVRRSYRNKTRTDIRT